MTEYDYNWATMVLKKIKEYEEELKRVELVKNKYTNTPDFTPDKKIIIYMDACCHPDWFSLNGSDFVKIIDDQIAYIKNKIKACKEEFGMI